MIFPPPNLYLPHTTHFRCQDTVSGKTYKRKHCSGSQPAMKSRTCNSFPCQYKWLVGPWEYCTKSCGRDGKQVCPLSQILFLFPFLTKSFICLEGKSMTPDRKKMIGGNTILFHSSQQLPRPRLGSSKGFLS